MHGALPQPEAPASTLRLSVAGAPDLVAALLARLVGDEDCFAHAGRTFLLAGRPGEDDIGVASADVSLIVAKPQTPLDSDTRKHAALACAAGVRHLVLVVDVGSDPWDAEMHERLAAAFASFIAPFHPAGTSVVPVSVAQDNNIATPGNAAQFGVAGPTLLSYLTTVEIDPDRAQRPLRLSIRESSSTEAGHHLCHGSVDSGTIRLGDELQEPVIGTIGRVERLMVQDAAVEAAAAGTAVAILLSGKVEAEPGDLLADPRHPPLVAEQFACHLAWLGTQPLLPGREYTLRLGARAVTATVTAVKHRIEPDTLQHTAARTLKRNEIGACTIATAAPIAFDDFASFPQSGRFHLCERASGIVIAAGTIDFALRRGINVHLQPLTVSKEVRASLKSQGSCVVWFTGLSGAGKSTIANLVEGKLAAAGRHTYLLDGDNVRHGLNKDLGFTAADRVENIRRVGEVAKLFVDAGLIVLCSFISPFRAERSAVRDLVAPGEFIEVYVRTPIEVCERRDPKGLYAKCRAGRLPNFTGIDSPYEVPENADLVLDTTVESAEDLAEHVITLLGQRGLIAGTIR